MIVSSCCHLYNTPRDEPPQQFPVLASDHAEKYRFEPDCETWEMMMHGPERAEPVGRAGYSCCANVFSNWKRALKKTKKTLEHFTGMGSVRKNNDWELKPGENNSIVVTFF